MPVGDVLGRLVQSGYVGIQSIGDGEAGGIVGPRVNARAGRKLLQVFLQLRVGEVDLILRVQRRDVVQDAE